ncbi:hypothetical protein HPB52_005069 [Rhipicephalus sanguineus]|uniref:exodeoxyribonuclease III n=1 Tax=Rhipicephalus sanguineus TaxID=34632 RepID=A0A9D4PG28_RHISA|nr:hypothetical protein HPB52_005069 [Rhipicephalus sanguineus]
MAPHRPGTVITSASDSCEADPSHLPITVARSASAQESKSAAALGDFTTGSDSATSSPDSSREAWVVDTSASEEQDPLESEAETNEVGQAALSVKDRDFPPLPCGSSSETSFDDTPIKSCGHYVLPSDAPPTAPGPSFDAAADISSGDGSSSGIMHGPGLERRHRSRSRRRPADGSKPENTGRAESAERAVRRSKLPKGSSDSDVVRRKNPKKPRKGAPFLHCWLMNSLRFATWNVRGFRDKAKQRRVVADARQHSIDIVFLQETNLRSPLDVAHLRRDCQVEGFFSLTAARSCRVGVVFVSGRFRQKSHCVFGANGRTLFLDVLIDGRRLRFVNVYAPVTRSDTNNYFRELHDCLQEPLPYVLLGDFNCVVDSMRDVRGPGRGGSTYRARELVKMLRHLRLTDAWVHLHNDEFGPTRSSHTTASRLDRVYIPDLLLPAVVSYDILALPDVLSRAPDHAPLVTTVRGRPGTSPSDAPWRLDPTLLQDPESVSTIQALMEHSIKATPCTSPVAWDNLKASWKSLHQQEGRLRKRRYTARLNEILRRMRIVESADSLTTCTRDYLEALKVQYDRLLRASSDRRRVPQVASGEPQDVDLRDVRGNGSFRITELKRPDGLLTEDPAEIESILHHHFNAIGNFKIVTTVKVLGVFFSCEGVAATTWFRAVDRASLLAERAKLLDPSLREKAVAVKRSLYALAAYVSRVAVMPSRTASELSKLTNAFLWNNKPTLVKRNLLQLAVTEGGLGLPHSQTLGRVLALKTARTLAQVRDYVGRNLLLYWCSARQEWLGVDRHTGPFAEQRRRPPACSERNGLPAIDVDVDPPARIVEDLTRLQLNENEKRRAKRAKRELTSLGRGTPREAQDFLFKKAWRVLPTRQRLYKFGFVPDARCPNCRVVESQNHGLLECTAGKPVWRMVAHRFGIRPPPGHNRNKGAFARLVMTVTLLAL